MLYRYCWKITEPYPKTFERHFSSFRLITHGQNLTKKTYRTRCSGQKTPDCSWGRLSEALGNWGSGNLEGGGFGERVGTGEVSLQATWDRGGRILSQLGGFKVSRRGFERGTKGDKGGSARGNKKQGECAMYFESVFVYIKNAWDDWMIPVVYIHNKIIGMNVVDNLNSV